MNNTSRYDRLLINLRILSRVEEHGRIYRYLPGYISLESNSRMAFIKRMVRGDSRKRSIDDISRIIDESICECEIIFNSRAFNVATQLTSSDSIIEILANFYRAFEMSLQGIKNLKSTYQTDITASIRLDLIQEKIQAYIVDMRAKCPCLQEATPLEIFQAQKRENDVAALIGPYDYDER